MNTIDNQNGNYANPVDTGPSVYCPQCGSSNVQFLTEQNVHTEGKDYSVGKGCLGWFLLGPLGLLCGLCGKGKQFVSENHLYWICRQCGHKFKVREELLKEAREARGNAISTCVLGGIVFIALFIASIFSASRVDSSIGTIMIICSLLIGGLFALAAVSYFKKASDLKKKVGGRF